MLNLENRLSNIRYEIESITTNLNKLNNLIDYTTVKLTIEEVCKIDEVSDIEPSFIQSIKSTFKDSIDGLVETIKYLILYIVAISPYLIIALIIYKIIRNRMKKIIDKTTKNILEQNYAEEDKTNNEDSIEQEEDNIKENTEE